MLDKSPEIILDDNLEYIQSEFKKNIPNLILYSNSFHKIEFLNKIISSGCSLTKEDALLITSSSKPL